MFRRFSNKTVTSPVSVIAALTFLAACGGGSPPPTMQGKKGMLDQTAVAAKCQEASKEHDRPFVVEWDATDLASFEARAKQETVFVKYSGCKLQVMYECSTAGLKTLGTYDTPSWTSGTVQGFDIKSEGELYAKLPLGAATLGGRVAAGETLHLKYFVAGVVQATREGFYRSELDKFPECKEATHFVWAYNLGAFELETSQTQSAEAEATGPGGIGAGGKTKHEEASLGHGGDLKSCSSSSQQQCRVPIRIALRKIKEGPDPAGQAAPMTAGGVPGAPPGGPPGSPPGVPTLTGMAAYEATPAGQASASIQSAFKKLEAGDGKGCLDDFDRAAKLDPKQLDNYSIKWTRARCMMRAGKCAEGTADLRGIMAAQDDKKIKSDEQLDKDVREAANRECPSSTAKNDEDFLIRNAMEMQEAAKAKDGKACQAKFDVVAPKMAKLDKKDHFGQRAHHAGIQAMETGAMCVANAKTCAAGEPLWVTKYKFQLPNFSGVEKTAKESWATLVKIDPRLKECKK